MKGEKEQHLTIEDKDLINFRVKAEVEKRMDRAFEYGTKLAAFLTLTEPNFGLIAASEATGMNGTQLYQLFLSETPIPPHAQEVIDKLYTIGATVWKECEEFEGDFGKRLSAARKKLTTPTFYLKKDPLDEASADRSMIQAVKDGDIDLVLSMIDRQLNDPKDN